MAKPTALSAGLMSNPEETLRFDESARAIIKAPTKPAKTEPLSPLQVRIPKSEAKNIKRAALEADQTISDYVLACVHAYMKK